MKSLRTMWSSIDFGANELTRYASAVMCREARQGIFVLGILTMVLMAGLALLYHALGLSAAYPYTFGVLALLAVGVIYLVFTGSPVAKTTSNSRGSGSGWNSLARATSPVGFSTHRRNYDNELMSGDFECGNPTGDALDALGRTHRSPAEFLDNQRYSYLGKVLEFYLKFITKVRIRLTLRSPAGGVFRPWHGPCCCHRHRQLVVVYQ